MIKVVVDGIEMEVVGIRKDRLLCEYIQVTELTEYGERILKKGRIEQLRKPSYKIKETRKGHYIQGTRRIYVDEQIKELVKLWSEGEGQ